MDILRVDIGCVKLIKGINLFDYYSDLVFFTYIHCFALVVLLIIIGGFH